MALEPYIDAHSHIWTPDVAHYPLAKGFTVADMQPRSFTAEELLAQCRPAGVGRVNLIQMSYYEFDNSYMLDMIKLYPDRFVGTGIVDPLAPKPDTAMRALLPKGVRAFRIAPNYSKLPPARWLEPAGYTAMFAAAAETKQALSCLINPDGFPEVDRMCSKFPDTTVIIDHLGRIGVDGTIKADEVDALCALAKHPKVLVKVGAFYALGKKTPPYLDLAPLIKSVVHAFGAKRCMWETDCPFQVDRDKYSDSVDLIRTRLDFLTPEDRDWMLTRTAEQTLFQPLK
ncbi:amidohydrolase family protein [Singulisphaera sp. Ch08]|uniref:Amidohydrolase family protein n=1 Tax=Singulisphaera sp. Ch08 TaxID=3120278 RepID=A0AAU7CNI3_9BACT